MITLINDVINLPLFCFYWVFFRRSKIVLVVLDVTSYKRSQKSRINNFPPFVLRQIMITNLIRNQKNRGRPPTKLNYISAIKCYLLFELLQ